MEKYEKVNMEWRIWIAWWSYSILGIQDYFDYIFKNHGENTVIPSIRIYVNKIENRITFKIKSGYFLKFLNPETIKLLGSTKSKITKDGNCENVLYLEVTEVVLIHCNVVNNSCQQNSRFLSTFVPKKSCCQLLYISPKKFIFLKIFNSELLYVKVWFTDQNSKPLEIEDKI